MRQLSKEELERIYRAVGYFTVNWAGVEIGLDGCIALFYYLAGRKQVDAEVPRSLERKLTFFKRALWRVDRFRPFATEGLALAERINALKRDRHDMVHGLIGEFNPVTEALSHFIIEYRKDGYDVREREITTEQITAWGDKAKALLLDMAKYTLYVTVQLAEPRDHPRKS